MEQAKKTPLYQFHVDHGAKIVEFGGYQMPLWYPSGAKNEHLAVLTGAGLFDTSHMGSILVEGEGAFDLLQHCFSRDIRSLKKGRCAYGVFLNDKGWVFDDSILYCFARNLYLVVVNAGMGGDITSILAANKGGLKVSISDLTDLLCKIDIQGPLSAKILDLVLVDSKNIFQGMGYFSFKGGIQGLAESSESVFSREGAELVLSRTGYTGEFGFEIFVRKENLTCLWERLVKAGEKFQILCCGLAARDSLRCGAVLPLSHKDIGNWPFINTPWDFALPFNDQKKGFSKNFIGGSALLEKTHHQYTFAYLGSDPRKIAAGKESLVVDSQGDEIGVVLSCVTDMGIGLSEGAVVSVTSPDRPEGFNPKGLCCGFIKVKRKLEQGEEVVIFHGRRKLKVVIVRDIRPHRTAQCLISEMV